jgi:sporulation protein YlmC with PRC-barrel domain
VESAVDEGYAIAYEVLEKGVPVYASDGKHVGVVHHVVAAPDQDIFHGLVITVPHDGRRFVDAADVESLHERGVDLRIDSAAVDQLPEPGGAAPSFRDSSEAMTRGWPHWVGRWVRGERDWRRES